MKLAFSFGPRPTLKARLIVRLIRWRTRSKFSHVEIVFSDGYSGGASADMGGVFLIAGKEYDPTIWEFVDIDGDELAARMWFVEHRGQQFDHRGILGFVWGLDKGDPDRWFCSEAVAAALRLRDPFRFDPAMLYALAHSTFAPRTRQTAEQLLAS